MKSRLDVMKALEANIPTEVVLERKGAGGKMLSYLEGWYVKQQLTAVFGLYWNSEIIKKEMIETGQTTRNGSAILECEVTSRLTVRFKDGDDVVEIVREDTGFGNGDRELAGKEAVTDALKRCAATLGNSTGLGLYDPSKSRVGAPTMNKADGKVLYKATEGALRLSKSPAAVLEFWDSNEEAIKSLPRDYLPHLEEAKHAKIVSLVAEAVGCAETMADLVAIWKADAEALKTLTPEFLADITKLKDDRKAALS